MSHIRHLPPWIGSMIKNGTDVRAIFQAATPAGAAIRVGLDGELPVLPPPPVAKPAQADHDDFWPDEIPGTIDASSDRSAWREHDPPDPA